MRREEYEEWGMGWDVNETIDREQTISISISLPPFFYSTASYPFIHSFIHIHRFHSWPRVSVAVDVGVAVGEDEMRWDGVLDVGGRKKGRIYRCVGGWVGR